jgi:uncharacterized protein YjbJ (UPF0337 family)
MQTPMRLWRTFCSLCTDRKESSKLTRSNTMSGKADELKGRVKEAAGAVTDDDELRREGKVDQAAGKTKQAVEKVVDKAKDVLNRDDRRD